MGLILLQQQDNGAPVVGLHDSCAKPTPPVISGIGLLVFIGRDELQGHSDRSWQVCLLFPV